MGLQGNNQPRAGLLSCVGFERPATERPRLRFGCPSCEAASAVGSSDAATYRDGLTSSSLPERSSCSPTGVSGTVAVRAAISREGMQGSGGQSSASIELGTGEQPGACAEPDTE